MGGPTNTTPVEGGTAKWTTVPPEVPIPDTSTERMELGFLRFLWADPRRETPVVLPKGTVELPVPDVLHEELTRGTVPAPRPKPEDATTGVFAVY